MEFILKIQDPNISFGKAREYGRDTDLMDNINRTGEQILVGLGAVFSLVLIKNINKTLAMFLVVFLTFGVLLTFSRQGVLVLVILFILFLIYFKPSRKSSIKFFLFLVPILAYLLIKYFQEISFFIETFFLENFTSINFEDTSVSNRVERQLIGINTIIENPFGLGVGTIKQFVLNTGLGDTHHFFLNITLQLGILTGVAFLLFWFNILYKYFKEEYFVLIWIPIFATGLINLLHLTSMLMWLTIVFPYINKRIK